MKLRVFVNNHIGRIADTREFSTASAFLLPILRSWPPGKAPSVVTVKQASDASLEAVFRLVELPDQAGDVSAPAPLVEQEIPYRLPISPGGDRLIHILRNGSSTNRVSPVSAKSQS